MRGAVQHDAQIKTVAIEAACCVVFCRGWRRTSPDGSARHWIGLHRPQSILICAVPDGAAHSLPLSQRRRMAPSAVRMRLEGALKHRVSMRVNAE